MKTTIFSLLLVVMITFGANASETDALNAEVRANQLIERVEEINRLDFSEMTFSEKRVIKAELRELNAELKELDGIEGLDDKVSISIGAIIIIILLIILI